VGHGSTVNPDSSAPTFDHAAAIRARGCFAEVRCAFWKEEPSLRQAFQMLESDDVYVVPNFISEGYFTRTVIPRELELDGPLTRRGGAQIKYCEPVGSHPRMTEVLLRRAREIAPGVPPDRTSLLIIGHGTNLNDNSAAAVKEQVALLADSGYAEVAGAYMEEEPFAADWWKLTTQPNVVAVPFFIADGLHSYEDIPVLLGVERRGGPVFRPYSLRGRQLYYAGAIGTEALFADVILDQVEAFDLDHAP